MRISIDQIHAFLKENNIVYEFFNEKCLEDIYQLASLKNIVPAGLYYIEKEYTEVANRISKSLIITNAQKDIIKKETDNSFLIVNNPQILFYKFCRLVAPQKKRGIHPTAIIDAAAKIHDSCYIGPYAIIGQCTIEAECYVDAHVVVGDNVIIKQNTRIEPNSYIGANGVAWVWDEEGEKVIQPQFGGVIIEEDCFIGSDVSIVRGSVNEDTIIGKGTLIAHGSKIGHGSILHKYCHLANNVSLAGNSKVGARAFLGAACVLSSHVSIGADSIVGAGAVVTKPYIEEGILLAGVPAKPIQKLLKNEKLNGVPLRK